MQDYRKFFVEETRFYLLKIRLLESDPEIWRRFYVPGFITLDRLHDVIQIVMGWEDYHLHEFTIGKQRYTENPESPKRDGRNEGPYCLQDLIKQKGRTFRYWYDFGDDWHHEICIEDSWYNPNDPRFLVYCIGGQRACPPEDVGGVHGYSRYLDILNDPTHEEHSEYLEWRGEFDSDAFDLGKTNIELLKYMRWSRDRAKTWTDIIFKQLGY